MWWAWRERALTFTSRATPSSTFLTATLPPCSSRCQTYVFCFCFCFCFHGNEISTFAVFPALRSHGLGSQSHFRMRSNIWQFYVATLGLHLCVCVKTYTLHIQLGSGTPLHRTGLGWCRHATSRVRACHVCARARSLSLLSLSRSQRQRVGGGVWKYGRNVVCILACNFFIVPCLDGARSEVKQGVCLVRLGL